MPIVPVMISLIITVVAAAFFGIGIASGVGLLILLGGAWFGVLLGGLRDSSMRNIAIVNLCIGVTITSIIWYVTGSAIYSS